MKSYVKLMLVYFFYEIIYNGLFPLLSNIFFWSEQQELNMDWESGLKQHTFDLCIVTSLLYIFRPRVWPQMFGVELLEDQNILDDNILQILNRNQEERRQHIPLLKTEINTIKFYPSIGDGGDSMSSTFNSGDAVLILNPVSNEEQI